MSTLQTDFVLDDESQENSYVTELLDVIRELNIQVQSKDEQLESVREELRSRSLWNKGDLHVSKVIYFLSITIAIVWLIKKRFLAQQGY